MTPTPRPEDPGHDSGPALPRDGNGFALGKRTIRAAEEPMTVVAIAPEMYRVHTAPDDNDDLDVYVVDEREGACECPDHQYNTPTGGCKHRRRVQMTTGERDIPLGADIDTDSQLVHQFKYYVSRGLDGLGYSDADIDSGRYADTPGLAPTNTNERRA